jgi:hypothetical protein
MIKKAGKPLIFGDAGVEFPTRAKRELNRSNREWISLKRKISGKDATAINWPRASLGATQGVPYARPQERSRETRGAEGATAPETLRQKDRGREGALESGG